MTGAKTIEKFLCEQTLFNPILDIEDFRCYEAKNGPRKQKATDGFFMLPEKIGSPFHAPSTMNTPPSLVEHRRPPTLRKGTGATRNTSFSPRSCDDRISNCKKERPRKANKPSGSLVQSSKKRGKTKKVID
uniref:Uncharacterized protein n=1 Tax=Cannabis sativa TaxID=3483 RepID=A0A803NTI0_CANSA